MKYCSTCRGTYPIDYAVCPKDQTALRPAEELAPGTVVRGKYEILERMGEGGMAVVYRARHLDFGELRALKVVNTRLAGDEGFLRRFRTEAIVTRKLQHPHAVRVDDLDRMDDGRPFIVMELVEGRSLRAALQTDGAFAVARALRLGAQVASALQAAHALGITHRDVKPENVLLVPDAARGEQAKVLDFGIAKVREGAIDTGPGYTPTEAGMVIGTPQYLAPEQAMGRRGDEVDGRADLYSLAVVIYEMLTGALPFRADTPMGVIMHHIQTVPRPVHEEHPHLRIPTEVSAVLQRALQKDPARRFASAEEMQRALEALADSLHDRPTQAMPAGRITAVANAPTAARAVGGPATGALRPPRPAPAPGTARLRPTAPPPRAPATSPVSARTLAIAGGAVGLVALAAFLAMSDPGGEEAAPAPATTMAPTLATAPPATTVAVAAEATPAPAPVDTAVAPAAPAAPAEDEDRRLLAEVRRVLATAEELKADAIEVAVEKNVVTLYGRAHSRAASDLAMGLARSVAGVQEVRSVVHVAEATAPPAVSLPAAAAETPPPGIPVGMAGGGADPNDPKVQAQAMMLAGKHALTSGDLDGAIAAFEQVLRLQPDNDEAKAGLALAKSLKR